MDSVNKKLSDLINETESVFSLIYYKLGGQLGIVNQQQIFFFLIIG